MSWRISVQRWRRGLRRRDGVVEAAVALPSRLPLGSGSAYSPGVPQLHCSGDGTGDGLGAAGGGCLL